MICSPGVVVVGSGISDLVDNASSLVSCGRGGGACMIVEVKVVGRVVAGPCCVAENVGAGNIVVELMGGCGMSELEAGVCSVNRERFCCKVCDNNCSKLDN